MAVADVRGHGEPVSDISQWLYGALRDRMNDLDGNTILAELNALACARGYEAMSTAVVVTLSRLNHDLVLSYAGHPPLLIYRRTVKRWEPMILKSQRSYANLPLGAFLDVTYDQEFQTMTAGDRLFVYTDGVIDAANGEGTFFGIEGIVAALERAGSGTPQDLKKAVGDALHDHSDGSLQHDDVTFMALEIR